MPHKSFELEARRDKPLVKGVDVVGKGDHFLPSAFSLKDILQRMKFTRIEYGFATRGFPGFVIAH